jgi:hypothetical protein
LICKGTEVLIELVDGSDVLGEALLHDPTGKWWPSRSCLIGSFDKLPTVAKPKEAPKEAAQYLGRSYVIRAGSVTLPPRAIGLWDKIGQVEAIYYRRQGIKARGRFRHRFNRRGLLARLLSALIKGEGKLTLYQYGRWYRLELPRTAILDDRGFVWP